MDVDGLMNAWATEVDDDDDNGTMATEVDDDDDDNGTRATEEEDDGNGTRADKDEGIDV